MATLPGEMLRLPPSIPLVMLTRPAETPCLLVAGESTTDQGADRSPSPYSSHADTDHSTLRETPVKPRGSTACFQRDRRATGCRGQRERMHPLSRQSRSVSRGYPQVTALGHVGPGEGPGCSHGPERGSWQGLLLRLSLQSSEEATVSKSLPDNCRVPRPHRRFRDHYPEHKVRGPNSSLNSTSQAL